MFRVFLKVAISRKYPDNCSLSQNSLSKSNSGVRCFSVIFGVRIRNYSDPLNKTQNRIKTFSLSLFSIVTSRAFPIDGKHVCRDWPSNCDWTISSLSFHLLAKKSLMNLNWWFSNMKAILMCQDVSDDMRLHASRLPCIEDLTKEQTKL